MPNKPGFKNARYDELSFAATVEIDRSKLYPLLAEAQSIYSEELPAVPLYFRTVIEATNPKLMNWEIGPYGMGAYKIQALYFK